MDRPRRIRVLYISSGYSPHDYRFLCGFIRSGLEPFHLPLTQEVLDERPAPAGVVTLKGGTEKGEVSDPRTVAQVVRDIRPDMTLAGPVHTGGFLAANAGVSPLVIMSWGSDLLDDPERDPSVKERVRLALCRADAVFGDCQAVAKAARKYRDFSEGEVVVFPWGVDLGIFATGSTEPTLRAELGWETNPVLISTRNWEPVYAIEVLILAFAKARRRFPEARLLLLADGSRSPEVRRLIGGLCLSTVVHTPGRVPNTALPGYYRLANLYVTNALCDGTSVSLLEAMAAEKPVIASSTPGNREWIVAGRNGWLAEPGSEDALASAIEQALDHAGDWTRIGAENRRAVANRANWDENFPRLVELFHRLAGGLA